MAKYAIFTPSAFDGTEKDSVVFLETEDGIKQITSDQEGDDFFSNWAKKAKPKFEDVLTGYSYYDAEVGEYSGQAKAKVDALIAKLKPRKVKIVGD